MDSHLRAAHADRQAAATALQHHTAVGRLSLEEYDQRVTAAWRAITLADLAALTADLPTEPTQRPRRRISRPSPMVLLAAIVLALLGAALVGGAANAQSGDFGGAMMAFMGGMCH